MAEQKFLGQAGTDVLVEKIKKNAEDILLQIPRSSLPYIDFTTKKLIAEVSLLVLGIPHLIKGFRPVTARYGSFIVDENAYSILSIPPGGKIDFSWTNFDYNSYTQGSTVTLYSQDINGLAVNLTDYSTTTYYGSSIPDGYVRWPYKKFEKNQIAILSGTLYQLNSGIDNKTYTISPVSIGSTSIEEITAQEVTDAFNS